MRVRFEMYKNGQPAGAVAECDLTPKKARERFEKLKTNAKCGWVELVAEEDDEGGYMEVIDQYDNTRLARIVSGLI